MKTLKNLANRLLHSEFSIQNSEFRIQNSELGNQSPESANFRTSELSHFRTSHPHPRRGVALLIVLGLLGLLLISAVGFAVLMRTERSAATNYRHTSSARQILYAALSRAIEDLDTDIGNSLNPSWTTNAFHLDRAQRMVSNPENILFSYYDNVAGKEEPVFARILTKDVMTYIPALFHKRLNNIWTNHTANVTAHDPDAESSRHPEWVPIKHDGSVVGRYAYAIIDTAGLLDASLVHATNRWMGGSMREVRIDPDIVTVKDIRNVANFTADRNRDGRYETIAELASLNTGIDPAKLSNFEVFSTFSTNVPAGSTPPVNLYGSAAEIQAKRTEILKAFENSGIPTSLTADTLWKKSDVAFAALMDYVDTDSVMFPLSNLDNLRFHRPCTEQIPLVNHFGIDMTHTLITEGTVDNPVYKHKMKYKINMTIATWPLAGRFTADDGPLTVKGRVFFLDGGSLNCLNNGTEEAVNILPAKTSIEKYFSFDDQQIMSDPNVFLPLMLDEIETEAISIPGDTGANRYPRFSFSLYFALEVYNSKGELCYQFPGDKPPEQFRGGEPSGDYYEDWARLLISEVNDVKFSPPAATETQSLWAECIDPRWGYAYPGNLTGTKPMWYTNKKQPGTALLSSVTGYTVPASYSPGNSLQDALLQNPAIAEAVGLVKENVDGFHDPRFGNDGKEFDHISMQRRMYVANAPLQTPGELAYLLFGPWETVRLYDRWPAVAPQGTKYHTVLDHFEVRDPAVVPKGKVNINSVPEDVLSLLFLDMPLRSERARTDTLDQLAAVQKGAGPSYPPTVLGKKLHTEIRNKVTASGKPIKKLSDLACIYANVGAPAAAPNINNPNPVSVVWNRCAAAENIRFGEFEREAVIRNVANLLTTKQQQFTIILRADAFTTRFGSDKLKDGTVLSSATAVAQVTRDPVKTKDASGREYNKTTVRMLKILE